MIWYIEHLAQLRKERQALEALVASAAWLAPGEWRIDKAARIVWDADIVVGDRRFEVSLQFPNHFPHSPPLVLPRGDKERWSSHQWGAGGELCLEFGPDNWHPDITGAQMIESAHRLLQGERPTNGTSAVVPSRHDMSIGQVSRGKFLRLLVTRSFQDAAAELPEAVPLSAQAIGMLHTDSYVLVISSFKLPDGTEWVDRSVPAVLVLESFKREIALVRWPVASPLPPTTDLDSFRAAASEKGIAQPDVDYMVLAHGTDVYGYYLDKSDKTATKLATLPPPPAATRLDEDHKSLAAKKVAIVGCGSLGSKLAAMLARTGVGKFLLVDDDILFPDNMVRNDLDWRDVGTHKADAVARRIKLVNPDATREVHRHKLGGQEPSGSVEGLIEGLAECDLVVDATADARVFNYLSAAVDVGKKALLWAEVYGGGIGGLIARHRPGIEPSPASIRRAIENWCADQGKPIERAVGRYEERTSGPPLIADDADVTVIAGHAARLAIDTLIARQPSMFPNSVYMIGLSEGWIFDQPFDTRPIEVGPPQDDVELEPIDNEAAADEMARVRQLFKNIIDASDSGPARS